MDEARAVMQRLERIEALDRERARPETLIAELRELVREAEEWVRAEGEPARAAAALDNCKESLDDAIVPA
ncbi:MAG: hypothetical protein ACYDA3_13045 [Gaiellaceae bacterium]